jgi:hypothetical protein
MNFMQRVRAGEVRDPANEIDDAIDAWHAGGSNMELHEFLGMTWEEYRQFVRDPEAIPK